MDNKAYLEQIATKERVKRGPILSPMLIKLIAAGLIALITLIIVGGVINGSNEKVTQSYESVYVRIANLSDTQSPLRKNLNRVKDSDLRSYTSTFLSTLNSTFVTLKGIASNIGIKADKISKAVQKQESSNLSSLTSQLDDALLTGTYDRTLGSVVYYQITMLLNFEDAARSKTNNAQFADLLDKSMADLKILQDNFKKWNDTN